MAPESRRRNKGLRTFDPVLFSLKVRLGPKVAVIASRSDRRVHAADPTMAQSRMARAVFDQERRSRASSPSLCVPGSGNHFDGMKPTGCAALTSIPVTARLGLAAARKAALRSRRRAFCRRAQAPLQLARFMPAGPPAPRIVAGSQGTCLSPLYSFPYRLDHA